jgi:hypothetical protein
MSTGKIDTTNARDENTGASISGQEASAVSDIVSRVSGPTSHELETASVPKHSSSEVDSARRTLLHAGWVVPVVLAVGLPTKIHAGSPPPDAGVPPDAPQDPPPENPPGGVPP